MGKRGKMRSHIGSIDPSQYLPTGQEEIEATCFSLAERFEQMRSGGQTVPELLLLPIYSTLPSDLQVSTWQNGALLSCAVLLFKCS
jgi:hypothetical protein